MADFELDFVGPGARLALAAAKRAEDAGASAGEEAAAIVTPLVEQAEASAERAEAAAALLPFESIPAEVGIAFGVTDADGYTAFDVESDGTFAPSLFRAPDGSIDESALAPVALARLLPSGFTGEWFTFPVESGHGFVITDLDDYIGFGVENVGDLTGAVGGGSGGGTHPVLHDIAVYADSMGSEGVDWLAPGEDWPSIVRNLSGRTVRNRSVPGQSAGQITARQGGDPCLITVAGNQIPASGSVAVTALSETMVRNYGAPGSQTSLAIILQGIPGLLIRYVDTGNHEFLRTTPGIAMPCPANSPALVCTAADDQECTGIFQFGRNGVASIMTTTIAKAEQAIRFMGHGRFLGVGVCNLFDGSEDVGSSNHTLITSYNNYMKARWGSRFFDVRRYMIDHALADAGITTPSSDDLAAIAADRIPSRFKESGAGIIHFNALANPLVGAKINSILTAKGY